jgi:hypothetical protein
VSHPILPLPLAGALLALALALGARDAVGAVRAGHLDGDLLLGVLRVGLEVVLDLGARLQRDEPVLGGLLDLLEVDEDVLLTLGLTLLWSIRFSFLRGWGPQRIRPEKINWPFTLALNNSWKNRISTLSRNSILAQKNISMCHPISPSGVMNPIPLWLSHLATVPVWRAIFGCVFVCLENSRNDTVVSQWRVKKPF